MRLWISTINNCFKIYVGIHRYRTTVLKPKEVLNVHVHAPLYQWNCIKGESILRSDELIKLKQLLPFVMQIAELHEVQKYSISRNYLYKA